MFLTLGVSLLYVADIQNNTIRKFTQNAGVYTVSTIAGLAGTAGSTNGTGTSARFNGPDGIGLDALGNLYVADHNNSAIRKITYSGGVYTVSTLTGAGETALLSDHPSNIGMDALGNLFLAFHNQGKIRKLTNPTPLTSMAIEVDSGLATVSAPLAATTVHKTGAGTSVFSGNNSGVTILAVDAGLVQVSATTNLGSLVNFTGGNMEI